MTPPPHLPTPRAGTGAGAVVVPDRRVRLAARVLAGEDVAVVAADAGVDTAQVLRWAHALSAGGADAVVGIGVERPSRSASVSRVVAEDYLGVVAHELRTPLTAARASLRPLRRADLDPQVRADLVDAVISRLAALENLASDLGDAVSITTGTVRLSPSLVDLAEVAASTCAAEGLPEPGGAGRAVVWADPARVRQIVATLLRHAQRYNDVGQVGVAVSLLDGAALLTVRCPGLVLDRGQAAELFEPFAAAASHDGNGLALYVVRALAVASGGQAGMAGTDGADGAAPWDPASPATVFWVRLPLAAAP